MIKPQVGDTFEAEMLPNKNAGKPIVKISGIVGFIHNRDHESPMVGETWLVSIHEIRDNYMIIIPVWKEMSIKETAELKNKKLAELTMLNKKQDKFIPVKKHYQFMRSDEIRSMQKTGSL